MGDNVRVAVRVRPFNAREKGMEAKPCFEMDKSTQQTVLINPEDGNGKRASVLSGISPLLPVGAPFTGQRKVFTFDYSYNSFVSRDDPEYASQRNVWDDIGVSMLENAWQGNMPSVWVRLIAILTFCCRLQLQFIRLWADWFWQIILHDGLWRG